MSTYPRVMVTGHRPQHLGPGESEFMKDELHRLARKLVRDHGMTVGISGMALGADMEWAWAVLSSRHANRPGPALWAFIPFPQQADRWSGSQIDEWSYLRSRADRETIVADSYSVRALHARNDAMLLESDLVIAVWNPTIVTGGTASCVDKAMQLGLPVIHVDPVARQTTLRRPR